MIRAPEFFEYTAAELAAYDVYVAEGGNLKERWVGIGDRTGIALRDYIERFRSWALATSSSRARGPPWPMPTR